VSPASLPSRNVAVKVGPSLANSGRNTEIAGNRRSTTCPAVARSSRSVAIDGPDVRITSSNSPLE